MLPLNEQRITYDVSFEEEHYLKLCTGEQIALQTITNDILKRFIKNDACPVSTEGKHNITLDIMQQYPIQWNEMDEIKKDCVDNSIYFKNEDIIRASFGKHLSRRKNDEITNKTFVESVNALLKIYDIKISQTNRVTVKGKKISNYTICVGSYSYDIVKHKLDNSYKPEIFTIFFHKVF